MFERKIIKAPAVKAAAKPIDIGGAVLRFLAEQDLPPTPANYALGHLILSNVNGLAARAADAVTMSGDRLSQSEADSILAAHGPRPEEDEPERADLRRHVRDLAEAAAVALADTGAFGRALAAEQGLGERVGAIVAKMVARAEEAENKLANSTREIEALRQEVETAKGDAARDALTGLLNRRGLLAKLAACGDSEKRMIAICDVDRFKSVNDRYGHVVGDRVLKLVANSLEESCRGQIVARWGGEEFLIVLGGLEEAAAVALVDAAREDLSQRNVKLRATDEPLGAITFSAGVAALGQAKLDDAVREADALLYRAKQSGRNQVIGSPLP